jgi:hypothetical protein
MDHNQFWHLVDSTRGQPDRVAKLAESLAAHTPDDIIRFRLIYDDLIQAANRVDLWGAAHVINGGCTDDGFSYFREGLIELGRPVFEAAVRDPDSLADAIKPGEVLEGTEGLGAAAQDAWVAKTGGTEEAFFEAVDAADEKTDRGAPEEGAWWKFDDPAEVRDRLPRLAAKMSKAGGG